MRLVLTMAAVAFAIVGCGPSTGITKPVDVSGSTTPSATTNVTSRPQVSSTLTAPHPPPNHWNDGTSYDPCFGYSTEQLRSWGLDSAKVTDVGTTDPQLRGCQWGGLSGGWTAALTIADTKVSSYLDPELYNNPQPINVAGVDGVIYQGRVASVPTCTVILPSEQATVAVVVVVVDVQEAKDVPDACVKSKQIATAVAPTLPK
ncbi:cell wall adhesion protein [Mycobacterium phage prophi91-4]|nr:cell wall adhesion protein [Mycobacterium phage prophi91-4]